MTALPAAYNFQDQDRRVVITESRLPQPWINYLSNGTLHAFVSQAGGGYAWWKSPLKNRLTRYRQYNLPIDSPGFYIYLREEDGTVWSPAWRPTESPLDFWAAEHEPGLTRFRAGKGDITATLDLFIAPDTDALVWDLTLENTGGTDTRLDVFGYVELCLLDWKQDTDWACYVKHNLQVTFDPKSQALTYLYRHFHFNPQLGDCPLTYFAASEPVISHAGDRDAFVGAYRDEKNPLGVERNHCGDSETFGGDPCAALQCAATIPGRGTKRLQFFLGGEPHAIEGWPRAMRDVEKTVARLRQPGEVDRLKTSLRQWWSDHLDVLQVSLPDADIARQINIWNPVQSVHTGRYSRSVSQHAAGVRTLGFRDTCQDMLAIAYRKPAWAAEVFRYLISQQYEDGHAPHQCNPTEKLPAEPRIHIDNPLWLPMVAHAIIAETGRLDLLDEKIPWLSQRDNLSPVGSDTIWEHLLRIPVFMEANLGAHGIPLTHKGDWNDSVGKFSKLGKGESLMAAQQYVHSLGILAEFALARNDAETHAHLHQLRARQAAAILACAWDGEWWKRGFDDAGAPIGSHLCEHGKIWLNTQTWAVLADVGSPAQKTRAMDAVARHLDTNFCGIKKLHPGFPSFPEVADPYSGYSPGCGENGAIFCHANTWAIIAEAMLGRAEKAWHYYRQLVPHLALQAVGLARYKAEPYAYVSNIIGPDNPNYGWANVTQVTGTAAWMDIAATQYLLGIRPELGGLRIQPCLEPGTDGFSAVRHFRGCRVEINVRRGVTSRLEVGGEELPGNLIPAGMFAGRERLRVTKTVETAADQMNLQTNKTPPDSASPAAPLRENPAGLTRQAFTLVELLVVISILLVMMGLMTPIFNSLIKTKGVSRAVSDVSEMIDLARSEAMSRNTYVWLGFNAAKVNGSDQLLAVAARSLDGTPNLTPTSNLKFATKVLKEEDVLLTDIAGLTTNVKGMVSGASISSTNATEMATFQTSSSSDKIMISVNGTSVNFRSLITFTPQGEALATLTPSTATPPAPFTTQIMLGFRRTNGGVPAPSDKDSSALVLYGGSGQIRVFRP